MHFLFVWFFKISLLVSAQGHDSLNPDANGLPPVDQELQWLVGHTNKLPKNNGVKKAQKCLSEFLITPLCDLVKHIQKNHSLDVDIAKEFQSRVVYVGEVHLHNGTRDFLIKNMGLLKKAGYTHLAMEMWNSAEQPLVDLFNENVRPLQQLQDTFSEKWRYETSEYMDLICTAHKNNLQILAIDKRDNVQAGLSVMEAVYYRDLHMVQQLIPFLKNNPKSKVIVFSGRLHAYSHFSKSSEQLSQPELLNQLTGIKAQSFIVVSERDNSPLGFVFSALRLTTGFVKMDSQAHYMDGIFLNTPQAGVLPRTCF